VAVIRDALPPELVHLAEPLACVIQAELRLYALVDDSRTHAAIEQAREAVAATLPLSLAKLITIPKPPTPSPTPSPTPKLPVSTAGLIAVGAGSQAGDVTAHDVAGRDVINFHVALGAAPPATTSSNVVQTDSDPSVPGLSHFQWQILRALYDPADNMYATNPDVIARHVGRATLEVCEEIELLLEPRLVEIFFKVDNQKVFVAASFLQGTASIFVGLTREGRALVRKHARDVVHQGNARAGRQ
jgi:hypothetical protein